MSGEKCPFCEIVAGRLHPKRYSRSVTVGSGSVPVVEFEPLNPVVPGHMLFIPCVHVEDASNAPVLTGAVFEAASRHASWYGVPFNLITSAGVEATQSIMHLHVHYVPRKADDGLTLPWTGQER